MNRFRKITAGLSAAAALALSGGHAQAATWLLDYVSTGAAPAAADLTVTTADILNAAGGYDITGVSGHVDADAVTGLIANPHQPSASFSADGLFIFDNVFYAGGAPVLSNPGLFFSGASGVEYNLFSDNASTYELYKAQPGVGYIAHSVGALTSVGVPEPAAWTLMIVGFGGVGAVLRRRRGRPAVA